MGLLQIPARPRAQRARLPTNCRGARHRSRTPPPTRPIVSTSRFDLSLPLPPQLEAAKFRLVSRAAELRRQGLAAPKTVANQHERWMRMLRLLDGGEVLDEEEASLLREAQALTHGGYLDILRLADASADTK